MLGLCPLLQLFGSSLISAVVITPGIFGVLANFTCFILPVKKENVYFPANVKFILLTL